MHIRSSGFSVLLKDTSTGNRTSNLVITKRVLYLVYHCREPPPYVPGNGSEQWYCGDV